MPGDAARKARAAAGSAVFLALAPGVVAGLVPWWLTGREARAWWAPLRVAGAVLLVAGVAVLLHAFGRFVLEGVGTPAPVAPTGHLATAFCAVVAAFVRWYEEPTLRRRFGAEYDAYRAAVAAWWPRRRRPR